jgi:hypothetical protein
MGAVYAACELVHRRLWLTLWVPNWSSTSCDLGVFVDQSTEPIATSDARLGRRGGGALLRP